MLRISSAPVCLTLALACSSVSALARQRPSLGALAREADARRPEPSVSAAPATAPIAARWKSEQEWIVSDVGSAIANIAAAANGTGNGGSINARAASGPGGAATLEITDHLWQPAAYVPMAKAALGSGQGTCRPIESPLIGALLETVPRDYAPGKPAHLGAIEGRHALCRRARRGGAARRLVRPARSRRHLQRHTAADLADDRAPRGRRCTPLANTAAEGDAFRAARCGCSPTSSS